MAWQEIVKKIAEKVVKDKIKAKVGEEVMSETHTGDSSSTSTGLRGRVAEKMESAERFGSVARLLGVGGSERAGGAVDTKTGATDVAEIAPESKATVPPVEKQSAMSGVGDAVAGAIGARIKAKSPIAFSIAEGIGKFKAKNELNQMKSVMMTQMAEQGADQLTIDTIAKMPVKDASELTAVVKNIQDVFSNTPEAKEKQAELDRREKLLTAKEMEMQKYAPDVVSAQLGLREKLKEQDNKFKTKEKSADLQKVESMAITALDNYEGLMTIFDKSPQGVIEGNVSTALGALTGGAMNTMGSTYADFKPMVSGQIYIGMTGDSRLSDKDAQNMAAPLLPRQGDSRKKNELKKQFMKTMLSERVKRNNSGDFTPLSQGEIMKRFSTFMSEGGESDISGDANKEAEDFLKGFK